MIGDFRIRNRYIQNNNTCGWSGTNDNAKRQEETRQKQMQGEKGKGKIKNKGMGKHHGKKGRKDFTKRRDTPKRKTHTHTSQDHTESTDTRWNNLDNWDDADWWRNERSSDLWDAPA